MTRHPACELRAPREIFSNTKQVFVFVRADAAATAAPLIESIHFTLCEPHVTVCCHVHDRTILFLDGFTNYSKVRKKVFADALAVYLFDLFPR